jgi:hypothetical protein
VVVLDIGIHGFQEVLAQVLSFSLERAHQLQLEVSPLFGALPERSVHVVD